MNIVIPMAGRGDRMRQAGYEDSKPMIDVLGKPMIKHVIDNIGIEGAHYIFIVQHDDLIKYGLLQALPEMVGEKSKCTVLPIDGVTSGAAITVLYAQEYIDNNEPLMTVNSDQIIDWGDFEFDNMDSYGFDGCIFTFDADCSKFSYAAYDGEDKVTEVAEKKVISDQATAGAYYWAFGQDYVAAAKEMVKANDRTNGEFYVAPVYNYAIKNDKEIFIERIAGVQHLGTPEELEEFVRNSK